jgi:alpha-galactosidase
LAIFSLSTLNEVKINLEHNEKLLNITAKNENLQNNIPVPVGWCSWYHFFEKISENVLLKNLD